MHLKGYHCCTMWPMQLLALNAKLQFVHWRNWTVVGSQTDGEQPLLCGRLPMTTTEPKWRIYCGWLFAPWESQFHQWHLCLWPSKLWEELPENQEREWDWFSTTRPSHLVELTLSLNFKFLTLESKTLQYLSSLCYIYVFTLSACWHPYNVWLSVFEWLVYDWP